MPLYLVGISHQSAPVSLRERLAYPASDLRSALEQFRGFAAGTPLAGGEFLILSTCNRTELYLAPASEYINGRGEAPFHEGLIAFLGETRGLALEAFLPHLYRRAGTDAVRHLCRVAAGLESMVLGEAEILGQVADARKAAAETGTMGPYLTAAFQHAVRAGRRARAETGICRRPSSVSSEAADVIVREAAGGAGGSILLLGTGPVARRAGEVLLEQGASRLQVVSRTWAHAEGLAAALAGGTVARPWCDLEGAIRESDAVLCATGAPHLILTEALVRGALAGRAPGRPLLLLDAALPRDVDPAVRAIEGVRLLDLDDLQASLLRHLEERRQESPAVEAVVTEEVEAFEEWTRGSALRPLLSAMHQHGEAIRRQELERLLRRIPDLPEEVRHQVEQLSHALVKKLLHEPSARLRAERDPGRRGAYAQLAQELFGLDSSAEPMATNGASAE